MGVDWLMLGRRNVRDQLTLAMRWDDGLADNSGSVAYEYCLTCDSAMSRRFVYDGAPLGQGTTQGDLLQGQRFVYDGLTLYRVDQIYDDDTGGLLDTDDCRVWWENTTMPALLGGHLAKRDSNGISDLESVVR